MAAPATQPPPSSVAVLDSLPATMSMPWYRFFSNLFEALRDATNRIAALPAHFVRQTADLSDVSGPIAFIPTDASGAALVFTAVNVDTYRVGNLVYVYGTLTYPATASGTTAAITLPVAVPNTTYAKVVGCAIRSSFAYMSIATVSGTSTASFTSTAAALTNANLSTLTINFFLTYPSS